jgi:hypothetical protein
VNPGNAGCSEQSGQGIIEIQQSGDTFSFTIDGEETGSGTISGAVYRGAFTTVSDGGLLSINFEVTLSNCQTGNGTQTWNWHRDSYSCNGGTSVRITKVGGCSSNPQPNDWVQISGTITKDGIPLCAMVLANGQHMFTCDPIGLYRLSVPLDSNGKITLYGFCEGLMPYKMVLNSGQTQFNIEMMSCR